MSAGSGSMIMPDLELDDWSLVLVRLGAAGNRADEAALVGVVSSAIERKRPFGLVVAAPAPLIAPARGSDGPLGWVRRHRVEVGTWCRGLCYVLPGAELARFRRERQAEAERLWGCRVHAGPDEPSAVRWVRARLEAGMSRSAGKVGS
jgi:hypothetical protein